MEKAEAAVEKAEALVEKVEAAATLAPVVLVSQSSQIIGLYEDSDESESESGEEDSDRPFHATPAKPSGPSPPLPSHLPPSVERQRRWQLGDASRAAAISDGVSSAMKVATGLEGGGVVACVAGGSGLCLQAAIQAGAAWAIAIEWSRASADAVRMAVAESGPGPRSTAVTVEDGADDLANSLATALARPSDLVLGADSTLSGLSTPPSLTAPAGTKLDALISEPYFEPLEEGCVWAKGHALLWWWSVASVRRAGLLPDHAPIWPALARLRGVLVSIPQLWAATRRVEAICLPNGDTLHLEAFGHTSTGPGSGREASAGGSETSGDGGSVDGGVTRTYSVWQHAHEVVSDPFDLMTLDFTSPPPSRLATIAGGVDAVALATGQGTGQAPGASITLPVAHAVVLWIDYAGGAGLGVQWPAALSTGLLEGGKPTPWGQGVHFLPRPIVCPESGNIARVAAVLDPLEGHLAVEVGPCMD